MLIYTIQIICFLLFGIVAFVAWRRHELWLYILAIVYAAFFENIDVFISRGSIGSYFYDERLILHIVETPLFIILTWGFIFYSSYILAKGLSKKFWVQAFTVPLLATIIDLPMDPIATKMGLWTWVGYGPMNGIMGVPLANYMGWFLVMLAFMLVVRFVSHIDFLGHVGKYIIIPPAAFMLFFLFFMAFSFFATTTGISIEGQFKYLQLFFVIFAGIAIIGWMLHPTKKIKIEKWHWSALVISRMFFYAFAIYGMIKFGFWQELMYVELIAFALVIEIAANIKFKLHAKT